MLPETDETDTKTRQKSGVFYTIVENKWVLITLIWNQVIIFGTRSGSYSD